VAANGALSGAPASANLGANAFMVLVVDSGGLSAVANLSINVTPPPLVVSLLQQGTNLMMTWTGGMAPYQVMTTTNLGSAWQNVGSPGNATNMVVTPSNASAFYLIQGQ
jgi:hypothetical protein